MSADRFAIEWSTPSGELLAYEPTLGEVESHAAALARAYNDPGNAPLMGHDETLDEDDVLAHYAGLYEEGARPFLLARDGLFVGDGDLRRITGGAAEFAFMVAAPKAQGQGLGTRFATMLHRFAFAQLGLQRVYASIVPANVASRRVFEKLGFVVDMGDEARAFADEAGDVVMAIDRATFEKHNGPSIAEIRIKLRPTESA